MTEPKSAVSESKALNSITTASLTSSDDAPPTPSNTAAIGEALKGLDTNPVPSSAPVLSASKVKILEKDVNAVVAEMEVSKAVATESLRRAGGVRKEALRLLVRSQ